MEESNKKMAIIASKGSLDFAYPPFILASTAAAMGFEVRIFFTFYGLILLKRKLNPKVTIDGNPAIPLKFPHGPDFLQNHEIPIPKIISSNLPGFDEITTKLMKDIGYGKEYRYAHNEPHAYAAGEKYFPDELDPIQFYSPANRGLEIKINEKLNFLKDLDKKNNNND